MFFKIRLFLLLSILILSASVFAQTEQKVLKKIYGLWFVSYSNNPNSKDTINFTKAKNNPYGFGEKIKIEKNGTFNDSYSSKCGNDEKRHNDAGKWDLDLVSMVFKTTIPVDLREKEYKIIALTDSSMTFVRHTGK